MRWKQIVPISLVSALSVGGLVSHLNASEGLNYIASVNGDVWLKRHWWLGYRSANVGDVLSLGDWLRVGAPNSSATVLCNNLSQWRLSNGDYRVSTGCNEFGRLRRAGTTLPSRGYENKQLPYLLSPRNTAVLPGEALTLTWNSVPDAGTYGVQIQTPERTIWTAQTPLSSLIYPRLAELEPTSRYLVTISTSTGVTSPEVTAPGILFWVLEAKTIQALETDLAKIETLSLEADAKTLAKAHVYRSYDLYQQGIEALETAVRANSQTAAIYQLQAELYQQIGLTREARGRYLKALVIANSQENLALQAELQLQLGHIARRVEDFEQAIAWLSAAAANYRALLDANEAAAQTQLSELQELIENSQSRLPEA